MQKYQYKNNNLTHIPKSGPEVKKPPKNAGMGDFGSPENDDIAI